MNIIFQISGGIGKCIAATAVCKAIKTKYPSDNLIVVSGYNDVFINNPYIYRSYNYNELRYFYTEYIDNKDVIIMAHDPYNETIHIQSKDHLIRTWCNMFDVEYNGEVPEIFLTEREYRFYSNKFTPDKPIFLIQPNGGMNSGMMYSWARDIPYNVVQSVIDNYKDSYTIYHIKREDQIKYNNVIPVTDNFRAISVLISISAKRLLIDSFAQHAAAALRKPSTVCWVANSPDVFGYTLHDNIVSNTFTIKPDLRESYLSKFNISGSLTEFPYNNEDEIFNTDDIIKSIDNQSSDIKK